MVFNSCVFILFFACVLLLHHAPFSWRVKKFNLLWASYLFYAAWNPPFVCLLWISTVLDWYMGQWVYRAGRRGWRVAFLIFSLAGNLGLLGFFKYGAFVVDNFVLLVNSLGIAYQPARPDIILPVGISFYTFQTLSYTLDIYRGKLRPWPSFLDYALYVTFFPQLVAGPIVRAAHFLPQCAQPRRASVSEFSWGLSLMVLGLFEKTVLADGFFAPVVERVYDAQANPDVLSAWLSTVSFAGQIFCDFAGYSTCAIGAALCLGFSLPDNFHFPYAAIGFSDFWRRWHISLSTWMRDYVYIPLGGSRQGRLRTCVNLMLTMLIGGLWHGASWTFVFWGGLHGIFLMIEAAFREWATSSFRWTSAIVRPFQALATFALVCFAWVFFRAGSFGRSFTIASAMLGRVCTTAERGVSEFDMLLVLATMVPMLVIHWSMRDTPLETVANRCPWWIRSVLLAAMLLAIATKPGENLVFLYFQF